MIGGILGCAGITGFLDRYSRTMGLVEDISDQGWPTLVSAWATKYPGKIITAKELWAAIAMKLTDLVIDSRPGRDEDPVRAFGRSLAKRDGRVFNYQRIMYHGQSRTGVAEYRRIILSQTAWPRLPRLLMNLWLKKTLIYKKGSRTRSHENTIALLRSDFVRG